MRGDHKRERSAYLKDVLICSLGAYGGPEAHYGVFTDQLVLKKKYLTEEELIELIALTGILPGPSSTQTIVAIGYKLGGPVLALLTMLVWSVPVLVFMTVLSFISQIFSALHVSNDILKFIGPMAVAFVLTAAFNIGKKVMKDAVTILLFLFGLITTYFIHEPWIYPLVLLAGGVVSIFVSKEKNIWNHVKLDPPWRYLISFFVFAVGSLAMSLIWKNQIIILFEHFYRYGYLVIGGGQVVVPFMYSELVEISRFMTNQEFLTGYGLVQGLPGPMFSFAAYAGGMSARGNGVLHQILGALAGGIGIFLPGILLIFFVYPVWEKLKQIKGIRLSLKGITSVAGGLIAASGLLLLQKNGLTFTALFYTLFVCILILTRKIPAPLIVILTLICGLLF